MTEKELVMKQIMLFINYYGIEDSDLFDTPTEDTGYIDIIVGDDFNTFQVSNPEDDESNGVYLSRPTTHPANAAVLPQMAGWVQVDEGHNPNEYRYKIIAIKK